MAFGSDTFQIEKMVDGVSGDHKPKLKSATKRLLLLIIVEEKTVQWGSIINSVQ
jgi:hypothetical protein